MPPDPPVNCRRGMTEAPHAEVGRFPCPVRFRQAGRRTCSGCATANPSVGGLNPLGAPPILVTTSRVRPPPMTPESVVTTRRPLAIAHRAANGLARLREAQQAGIDVLECDVWLYRGR